VSFFLVDRLAPAQRSASVASYVACGGGLTVDDGNYTSDRSDNNFRKCNKSSTRASGRRLSVKQEKKHTVLPSAKPLLVLYGRQCRLFYVRKRVFILCGSKC
jgi:hypothetical protein